MILLFFLLCDLCVVFDVGCVGVEEEVVLIVVEGVED